MAMIIDSLLVTLGLDSKDFDAKRAKVKSGLKDTRDDADKAGKSLKKAGKDAADGFEEASKKLVTFLAILGGTSAIKRFIEDTIESSAALDRFSRNIKESADSVSAWSNAAEQAGGTAEGLQGTMDMLSKSQTELALTGQSGLIPYFTSLGVNLATINGQARPVSDILLDLADRFSHMDRNTANNMGRMMGIDQGTMNLLLQGRKEVELIIARQKEYGAVTKKQAEEASRLRLQIVQSTQSFKAFGRELLESATPTLEKMFKIMADFGAWCVANKAQISDVLTAITVMLVGIGVALTPINLTTAALVALGTALALVYEDYKTWKAGGESLIPWDKWKPGIDLATSALLKLKDIIADILFRGIGVGDFVYKAATGDWEGAKIAAGAVWNGIPSESESSSQGAPASKSKSAPRGIRNNNPGNLNFVGQAGATKEGGPNGRFAVFGNMRQGVAALVKQIGLYVGRGKNTIRKIIETYAPAFENNTQAYIEAVSKAVGLSSDEPLDINNANQVMALVRAITDHENGKGFVSDADISGGFNMAKLSGIPGASRAAGGASASRVAKASSPAVAGGSSSVETSIGNINVYTQATDADGIAKDMGKSMNYLFTSQANVGVN